MRTKIFFLSLAGLLTVSAVNAAINIDTVLVGNVGNLGDPLTDGSPGAQRTPGGFGSVSYDYYIGTYEVTNAQYATFLNVVASADPHGLYNTSMAGNSTNNGIMRSGSSGNYSYTATSPNKPVNYVSFWDAARFTNWLTTGNTETGVYNLGGVSNPSNITITRNATAWENGGVAIANENEWYKAAYYDPTLNNSTGGYWLYPTQSNSITKADANYSNGFIGLKPVGTYALNASYYGTFDQGGNVWELLEDENTSIDTRRLRGGSFSGSNLGLQSLNGVAGVGVNQESFSRGFRVTSLAPIVVPEPSTYAMILGGLGLLVVLLRRNGRSTL